MKKRMTFEDVGIWSRPLSEKEITSIYEGTTDDNLVHVSIVHRIKKGFWNHLFLRREFLVFVNGVENIRYKNVTGTVSWWAVIDQSKASKLQYPFKTI